MFDFPKVRALSFELGFPFLLQGRDLVRVSVDEVHNHLHFGELRPLRGNFHNELFARPSEGLRHFHSDAGRGDGDAVEVFLKELQYLSRTFEIEVRPF